MSLDPIKGGFKKGEIHNPNGRPKGSKTRKNSIKVQERLLHKYKVHPVDKLVECARFLLETGRVKDAADIWMNLLKYCDSPKRAINIVPEKTTAEESKDAAEETFRLLQEIENGTYKDTSSSENPSVEPGKA